MHSNILNFINTISISGDSEYANTIEIKREIKESSLANSGRVRVTDNNNEIGFVFDNDTGELLYMHNYKQ